MITDEDELRKSCEDEILEEYKEAMRSVAEKQEEARKAKEEEKKKVAEAKQREKNNASAGWGSSSGWGGGDSGADNNPWGTNDGGGNNPWAANGSGGDDPWGNGGETNKDPWGADNNSATTATAKPVEIDLSKMGDDHHIRSMSNQVVEGLKRFQMQPCFMLETRRFVVIDSSNRVGIRPERVEVEAFTADKFVKLVKGDGLW
ncbi:hypothetical protein RSAG8_01111, partial [Rhizoctonia solani AG-8 WAC10335]